MKKNIIKSIMKILLMINTSLFIISFSFAFIILFRPFYYYQIKSLDLEKETGYTYNEIKEAYDNVLDYLVLNKPFKTGKFKYSEEGKSHFKDCKILFIIDFIILGISTIILIIKKIFFNKEKIFNHSIEFISSISILILIVFLLLIVLIIGFDKSFSLFHNIFFLGKSNWLLDPDYDEIINILPIEYFMNCCIFILSEIGIISLFIIIKELVFNNKKLYIKFIK